MAGYEIVRKDDPRWFFVQPPRRQRKTCRSCVFGGKAVRMKVWHTRNTYSWRCPCCAYQIPIDTATFEAWRSRSTA